MRIIRALALATTLAAGVLAAVPANAASDAGLAHRRVCVPKPSVASCRSELVTRADGVTPRATVNYSSGLRPADLQSAYSINPSGAPGSGPIIAIVDAYDNPNAEADLNVYREQFGLGACTTDNGCFTKVNQSGGSTPPAGDVGWGQEIALDLDMASAICPQCKLLLVEGTTASLGNLATAVDRAVTLGAVAVSNSYGMTSEASSWITTYGPHYNHPGIAITVSSGDSGYGISFPDDLATVIAVGGTNLKKDSAGNWTETVWKGAGSGCSSYVAQPSWQKAISAITKVCSRRVSADVSAVADPNTGVAVYDSYGSSGGANWLVFGGTSASAPIIAAAAAAAGHHDWNGANRIYAASASAFHDVTSGINGSSCRKTLLCQARVGYDGPTGRGTPKGLSGF